MTPVHSISKTSANQQQQRSIDGVVGTHLANISRPTPQHQRLNASSSNFMRDAPNDSTMGTTEKIMPQAMVKKKVRFSNASEKYEKNITFTPSRLALYANAKSKTKPGSRSSATDIERIVSHANGRPTNTATSSRIKKLIALRLALDEMLENNIKKFKDIVSSPSNKGTQATSSSLIENFQQYFCAVQAKALALAHYDMIAKFGVFPSRSLIRMRTEIQSLTTFNLLAASIDEARKTPAIIQDYHLNLAFTEKILSLSKSYGVSDKIIEKLLISIGFYSAPASIDTASIDTASIDTASIDPSSNNKASQAMDNILQDVHRLIQHSILQTQRHKTDTLLMPITTG
jgi:hypothetical protein